MKLERRVLSVSSVSRQDDRLSFNTSNDKINFMCCNFACKSLLSVSVSCRLVTSSCIHLFSSTLLLRQQVFFAALWLALCGPLRTDVCYLHLSVRAHRRCLWMLSWTFCLCFWPKCWSCLFSTRQDNTTCPICRANLADGGSLAPPHLWPLSGTQRDTVVGWKTTYHLTARRFYTFI